MSEVCEVVITAPDLEWLTRFSRRLVEDRLCAAAHVSEMRSTYQWEGRVHNKAEGRVALHTRQSLVSRIVERTNREHPYEVPCVVAVPIVDGAPAYVQWILSETSDHPTA